MTKQRDTIAEQLSQNSCRMFQGCVCHPEPAEIARMVHHIRQVLLPNYFKASSEELRSCIDVLHQIMAGQIHRAMYRKCLEKDATDETKQVAFEKADQILLELPNLQEMLFDDVKATYNGDPAAASYDEIILTYPGLYAITIYRVAHVMQQQGIPMLPRMMTEYAHKETGIDIHPGAVIGRGLMIDHGTGIVVGETAVVGNNVKLYQGVTLGALYFPRDDAGEFLKSTKRHPTVEDSVILYANATVLGGDTVIGHHSVIGSNAWVTDSVPPFSKVIYRSESIVKTQDV